MTDIPEVRIAHGTPTPEEEEAVRTAILRIWREGQAAAARARPADPWVLAARAESTRQGPAMLRARPGERWRLSMRIASAPVSHISIGRGDAR